MDIIAEPEINYKTGYISLFRSIQNHWVYEKNRKRTKFEAWIDILILACHKDSKEPIGFDLIQVNRGQFLTSQETLSKRWKWDRNSVRRFLKMLQDDSMVVSKTTMKYTMITVCNYDSYQKVLPSDPHKKTKQAPQKDQVTHTYNNDNNDNNVNNDNKNKELVLSSPAASDGIYPKCMDLYNAFCLTQTSLGAKIDGMSGKAMNRIITYLKKEVKNKENLSAEVPHAFEYILNNYDKWSKFEQGQLKLTQIDSNLTNIIKSIKNGKSNSSQQPQSKYAGA